MRSQQRIQTVVAEISLEGNKSNSLENNVAEGIGEHFFFDPVSPIGLCIRQLVDGNAGLERGVLKPAVTLFFREIVHAIGDDQPQISSARLIETRIVDFI